MDIDNDDEQIVEEHLYIDVDEQFIEEDDGYGSETYQMENQTDDDGAGPSAGLRCDTCSRIFNTQRGLNIHKASHKRKIVKRINKL